MKFHPSANHRKDKINPLAINRLQAPADLQSSVTQRLPAGQQNNKPTLASPGGGF